MTENEQFFSFTARCKTLDTSLQHHQISNELSKGKQYQHTLQLLSGTQALQPRILLLNGIDVRL